MNYIFLKPLFILATIFTLSSCEDVIVLDLQTSTSQVVIQADLNVTDNICTVLVNRSSDFYDDNDFEEVEGAVISLSTSAGEQYDLEEITAGKYEGVDIVMTAGETATITVVLSDDEMYTATAIVPSFVALDSLIIMESPMGGGPGGGPGGGGPGGGGADSITFDLTLQWMDLADEANFYRAKIYENETYQSDVYILANDVLGDGVELVRPVIRKTFKKDDEVRVELLSVNKGYYNYFTDIANSDGRGFSAPTPYNPGSNLDNKALGYFGVWTRSEKTVIVE